MKPCQSSNFIPVPGHGPGTSIHGYNARSSFNPRSTFHHVSEQCYSNISRTFEWIDSSEQSFSVNQHFNKADSAIKCLDRSLGKSVNVIGKWRKKNRPLFVAILVTNVIAKDKSTKQKGNDQYGTRNSSILVSCLSIDSQQECKLMVTSCDRPSKEETLVANEYKEPAFFLYFSERANADVLISIKTQEARIRAPKFPVEKTRTIRNFPPNFRGNAEVIYVPYFSSAKQWQIYRYKLVQIVYKSNQCTFSQGTQLAC